MNKLLSTLNVTFGVTIGLVGALLLVGCAKEAVVDKFADPAKKEAPKAVSPAMLARRSVKGTTDADAAKIDKGIKDTTIEDLIKNTGEGELGTRQAPFETTIWRVKATVESIELKKDGDYYMVLRGEKGGQTVVEVPDPATCKGSPMEAEITKTRKELEEKYHPTSDKKDINEQATITGVGFLGFNNNPKKKGSGGITGARLMPGTEINFDKK